MPKKKKIHYPPPPEEQINPLEGIVLREDEAKPEHVAALKDKDFEVTATPEPQPTRNPEPETRNPSPLHLVYENAAHGIWLYNDNCLAVLDAIAAKYPEGRFDCIFADPPYFLSNGGITCHAGRMVKVDKGDWQENHIFETFDDNRLKKLGVRRHSQTRMTRQPLRLNARVWNRSRSRFR